MLVTFKFLTIFVLLIDFTYSQAPLCPSSGSTLLDDTYPTKAFVISTRSNYRSNVDKERMGDISIKTPAHFVTTLLNSYDEEFPDIIVPTTEEEFKALKDQIRENLKSQNFSDDAIETKLLRVTHAKSDFSYTWQQDYFESFVDLQTGNPVLRAVEGYSGIKTPTTRSEVDPQNYLSDWANSLGGKVQVGDPLKSSHLLKKVANLSQQERQELNSLLMSGDLTNTLKNTDKWRGYLDINSFSDDSWGNGEAGGNIEGLPGGLCLKGNNQSDEFVAQYCGDKKNVVEVDVGWLAVGHTDEVIKVVPIFPKVEPAECSFSIWVASPEAAIETLKSPEYANRAFIELKDKSLTEIEDIHSQLYRQGLCSLIETYKKPNEVDQESSEGVKVIQSYLKSIKNIFNMTAYAIERQSLCLKNLSLITNREMVELLEGDPSFIKTTKLVQEKMNDAKNEITKKLKEKLPQCKNIQTVDVPNLFYTKSFAELNGEATLAEPGRATSIFPNPTNSVLANKTLIISETPNFALNDYMNKLTKKQGLKSEFIDTWNYAHMGGGNIHCSSHSIPYCRPSGKGQ